MLSTTLHRIRTLQDKFANAQYDRVHSRYGIALTKEEFDQFIETAKQTGLPASFYKEHYALNTLLLEPHQYEHAKLHLLTAEQAITKYEEMDVTGDTPQLHHFPFGTSAVWKGHQGQKFRQLLRATHLLAMTHDPESPQNALYTTLCERSTVVDAIESLRPDIGKNVRNRMLADHIDPDDYGKMPITPHEIEEFTKSYKEVTAVMASTNSPAAAEQKMEEISRYYLIRRSPPKIDEPPKPPKAKRHPLVERGEDGHVRISRQPPESSVNRFLLPLEVLEPIRDTLKRIENAQSPQNSGEHEKMRRNPAEAWIGYSDRSLMVARGRQLEKLLEIHPHLKGQTIQCVTIYPQRDSRKTHVERQPIAEAHNEPVMSKKIRAIIVQHQPEYWMAVPEAVLSTLALESAEMRTLTTDVKALFEKAQGTADAKERDGIMKQAEQELQFMLDYYKQLGVLSDHFSAKALRSERGSGFQAR